MATKPHPMLQNMRLPVITAVTERYFADGGADFHIDGLREVFGRDITFYADWSCAKECYLDLACLRALAESGPSSLTIVIPFIANATMERETVPGTIVMANVDSRFIGDLPCRKRVVVYDLHTLQNQFYFPETAVVLETLVPMLVGVVEKSGQMYENCTIVFPDDGAAKRYGAYFPGRQQVVCAKKRVGEERIVVVNNPEDIRGACVIVDDLVRTGGTLIKCAEALREHGVEHVSCAVPHAVFPCDAHKKFAAKGCPVEHFVTTDSVVGSASKLEPYDEFTVVTLCRHGTNGEK